MQSLLKFSQDDFDHYEIDLEGRYPRAVHNIHHIEVNTRVHQQLHPYLGCVHKRPFDR